jgi:hypothetical protein
MKSFCVYFGTDTRPWTPNEIKEVLQILNDKRSWGMQVFACKESEKHCSFFLSSTASIQTRFKGSSFEKSKLSVTDRTNPYHYIVYFNLENWTTIPQGARESGYSSVADYRKYVVNHEFGHVLGLLHVECPGPGELCPVMKQQTLGTGPCVPCVWPAICGDRLQLNK